MNSVEHLLGSAALTRHGKRVALVCGEQALSYEALATEVARASGALRLLVSADGAYINGQMIQVNGGAET